MGRATFIDLLDGSGRIQVMLRRNVLEEDYGILEDLDLGDWIGVSGEVFRTRAGEVTVEAGSMRVLCKSLRPLPEKWHGLVDVEARYRQRYLDLIANEEARRTATLRPRIVSAIRRFMDERGFLEVETPVLVPVAAGAMAHPFVTHHNALNRDLFLRIATELYLKRLIVGGLEKVYEIGKVFRNEGVDQDHSPEFTMMESYESFADYNDVMSMVEELVSGVATQITGSAVVEYGERTINFTPPWPRLGFREQVIKYSGIDFLNYPDTEDLKGAMRDVGVDVSQQVSRGGLLDKLISAKVEQHLVQPTFLIDYPIEMSPLSKKKADSSHSGRAVRGLRGGNGILQRLHGVERPGRPTPALRGAGRRARGVRGRRDGQARRGLPRRDRARDAAHRRAGAGNRPANHAAVGSPEPARGRAVSAASQPGRLSGCAFGPRLGGSASLDKVRASRFMAVLKYWLALREHGSGGIRAYGANG